MRVNYVIDASSIINLLNGDALALVCRLQRCRLWLTPGVVSECKLESAAEVMALRANGLCEFVDDDLIPTDLFSELLTEHELGEGETESIAACCSLGFDFCCDDAKARRLGVDKLDDGRVIGSLRLLRWCVEEELANCDEVFAMFGQMRAKGGFLPEVPHEYFCTSS